LRNRIEVVRSIVDPTLQKFCNPKYAYSHTYGVAQSCALIAMKRKENIELAVIAGMLHDIHTFTTGDSTNHAIQGAQMAQEMLLSSELFDKHEIIFICQAIRHHSDKLTVHSSFDEVLIDADVMQHCLYDPNVEIAPHEKQRFDRLVKEFGLSYIA
jgi:uncharacterized protein